tara:strand:+ start:887 stop:1117 length:231 start_codon:yes stop_codon:yes gene_type:complete
MARPSNNFESLTLSIAITPQIKMYLEDLTLKGTFGSSAGEAARVILGRAIDDMLNSHALKERQFKLEDGKVVCASD